MTSSYMGQETRYKYNSSDELIRVDEPNNRFTNYVYDSAGNLSQARPDTGLFVDYSYNSRNQLISLSMLGISSSYSYDHAGRRIEQRINGTETTKYLWDEFSQYGDVVYESRNNASSPYTAYTLANGLLISQTDTHGSLYFLTDAQNSTRLLTDGETGGIASSYSYDAFGELQENYAANSLTTHYLYTGQQYDYLSRGEEGDPSSKLYSLRARYYDPSLGRFMSRDTWAYNYQNPMELNRYVYVHNNPVNFVDPSGHEGMVVRSMFGMVAAVVTPVLAFAVANWMPIAFILLTAGIVYQLNELYERTKEWTPPDELTDPRRELDEPIEDEYSAVEEVLAWLGLTGTSWHPDDNPRMEDDQNPDPWRIPWRVPAPPTERLRPRQDGCNPISFSKWWRALPESTKGNSGKPLADAYEARVARGIGTEGTSRVVPTGSLWRGTEFFPEQPAFGAINADGAIISSCALVDAKYDGAGQYRLGGPPWMSGNIPDDADWINRLDGEMFRYRMALITNPVIDRLIIRTNTISAHLFFQAKLVEFGFVLGIDSEVQLVP